MVYKNQLLLSFLLMALITVLSGCADKKDTASSCLVQLDAEKYQFEKVYDCEWRMGDSAYSFGIIF